MRFPPAGLLGSVSVRRAATTFTLRAPQKCFIRAPLKPNVIMWSKIPDET